MCVVEVIGDFGSNDTTEAVLTEASEVASPTSSQCVVAQQPRVRCSRVALFVPTGNSPERGKMGGGADERRNYTNW